MSATTTTAAGPSALGGGAKRFFELTLTLAQTEFKVRYFGSFLGYLWSLVRPLLFFGMLYVVFTQIFHFGRGTHYGAYLLTAIVLWSFFSESTGNCVDCLLTREGLLRKMRFPRMVIPLSVALTSAFNLALSFVVVVVFALINGVDPRLSWLELAPITLGFIVIATGFGMLLSALYVRFRDVKPIWEVGVLLLFYASPIMYLAVSYKSLEHVALVSPFAMLLTQMGHAWIGGPDHPSAVTAAGGAGPVVAAILITFSVFALGWWFFTREAPRVAENL